MVGVGGFGVWQCCWKKGNREGNKGGPVPDPDDPAVPGVSDFIYCERVDVNVLYRTDMCWGKFLDELKKGNGSYFKLPKKADCVVEGTTNATKGMKIEFAPIKTGINKKWRDQKVAFQYISKENMNNEREYGKSKHGECQFIDKLKPEKFTVDYYYID